MLQPVEQYKILNETKRVSYYDYVKRKLDPQNLVLRFQDLTNLTLENVVFCSSPECDSTDLLASKLDRKTGSYLQYAIYLDDSVDYIDVKIKYSRSQLLVYSYIVPLRNDTDHITIDYINTDIEHRIPLIPFKVSEFIVDTRNHSFVSLFTRNDLQLTQRNFYLVFEVVGFEINYNPEIHNSTYKPLLEINCELHYKDFESALRLANMNSFCRGVPKTISYKAIKKVVDFIDQNQLDIVDYQQTLKLGQC